MPKNMLLSCALLSLLGGCATAPTAPPSTQVQVVCPRLPALEPLDPQTEAALAKDYSDRMENFLRGKLPTPTGSELPLPPAEPGIKTLSTQ